MTANDDLQERVEQLEETVAAQNQTIKKMLPNRRQTLKAMGLVGTGGILHAASGTASASTGSAGDVGTSSDRPDVFADAVDANSVSTDSRTLGPNDEIKFAASDNELDTAISNASQSDVIYLGRGTFSSARTISTRGLSFIGLGIGDGGTELTGDWDLAGGENTVQGVRISGGSITISGVALSTVERCSAGPITVDGGGNERALITGCAGVDVTFASGSSGNVVDACTNSTATDSSGNNTIGEIN